MSGHLCGLILKFDDSTSSKNFCHHKGTTKTYHIGYNEELLGFYGRTSNNKMINSLGIILRRVQEKFDNTYHY